MVITAFLHLIRVFYSQSIYHERRKNWYYGLLLFTVILAFNFTGYLLPWDQLSYWAVTIMTNIIEYIPFIGESFAHIIRGGEIVNENTLLNFYTFHTALLPILFIVFMVLHFWLIRKAKGVTIAQSDEKNMVPVNPELIYKEILVGLILLISIILFSISFDAPLLEKANPMISPNPSKAPWYFIGIQELLIHLHPVFVSLVIPLSLSLFFVMIAKINIDLNKVGTWFYSAKGKRIVFISIAFSFFLTLSLIFTFEYALHLNELSLPLFISTSFIPFSMYIIPVLVFILYLKKGNKADKIELTLSIMTIILSSYIVMSIVGIWLRGTGMHLIF
jgi:quinol-cytochrome oxidoreductase complex cytochrome b subunit